MLLQNVTKLREMGLHVRNRSSMNYIRSDFFSGFQTWMVICFNPQVFMLCIAMLLFLNNSNNIIVCYLLVLPSIYKLYVQISN